MIKLRMLIWSLVILLCNQVNAQTWKLGMKAEPFVLISEYESRQKSETSYFLTSFYLSLTYKFDSDFSLMVKPGILLSEDLSYNGVESCILGKYVFYDEREYFTCGIVIHSNLSSASNTINIENKIIYLGSISFGTKIGKFFDIEVLYQVPVVSRKYGTSRNSIINYNDMNNINLDGIVKLGIGIEFDL